MLKINRKILVVCIGILLLLFFVFLIFSSRDYTENPNDRQVLSASDTTAGLEYAILYNTDVLFSFIEEDEDNLGRLQDDFLTYGRLVFPELEGELVGFTINQDTIDVTESTYTAIGKFYGTGEEVEVIVENLGRGKISLSLTSTETKTNRDDSLNLGGKRAELLSKIPIETNLYSILYKNNSGKILVAFYSGFNENTVKEVVAILENELGERYDPSTIIFTINGIGERNLDRIYELSRIPDVVNRYQEDPSVIR